MFNLGVTYEVSSPHVPLIFVLSSGVDPRNMLQQLAVQKGMTDRFRTLALGQGQGIIFITIIIIIVCLFSNMKQNRNDCKSIFGGRNKGWQLGVLCQLSFDD